MLQNLKNGKCKRDFVVKSLLILAAIVMRT